MENTERLEDPLGEQERRNAVAAQPAPAGKKRANMHDGIGVWCDCCSCEAEPYWAELADEMGVNLGGCEEDYKPVQRGK